MVHRSNAQFERCHSAELADSVGTRERYDCWDDWIRHHAEGQAPHRVLYARERKSALSRGETMRRLPDGTPVAVELAEPETATDAAPAEATAPASEPVAAAATPSASPTAEGAAAPAATNPAAPTPETATASDAPPATLQVPAPAASADAAPARRTPRYRGDPTCQPVCSAPWDRCIARCDDLRNPCIVACENEYRACMQGCF